MDTSWVCVLCIKQTSVANGTVFLLTDCRRTANRISIGHTTKFTGSRMIVLFFIIVLQISLIVHIYFTVSFISKKQDKDFRGFFITAIVNIFMAIFIAFLIILYPGQMRQINIDKILFFESGAIFFVMLFVKMRITLRIYKKSKDPSNYHFNVFGKKVLHKNVATPQDVMIYFMTLPITLISGAYFIVKLKCN